MIRAEHTDLVKMGDIYLGDTYHSRIHYAGIRSHNMTQCH